MPTSETERIAGESRDETTFGLEPQSAAPTRAAAPPAPAWNGRGGGFALGKCWRKQRTCIVMALALQGRSIGHSSIDAHESIEVQPLQSNGHTINLLG